MRKKSAIANQILSIKADLTEADWRLALDVRIFVGAGTETTGNTLTVTTYHLLANPDKAKKLKEEVNEAEKKSLTPLRYHDLQRLPYLV
jgi:cytochrome P450